MAQVMCTLLIRTFYIYARAADTNAYVYNPGAHGGPKSHADCHASCYRYTDSCGYAYLTAKG